jgi:AmmeMemoRadiSam system protein B
MSSLPPNKTVRPPAFAGQLYPADKQVLASQIDAALEAAHRHAAGCVVPYVKTILAPYGNHRQLQTILAETYRHIASAKYDLVVLLAPAVQKFNRLTISGFGYFATPLGELELSDYVRNELCDEDDDFFISEQGLETCSAIEVQLPFIQRALAAHHAPRILPMLIGNQSIELCNEAAAALSEVLMSKNALLIALNCFALSPANTHLIEDFQAGLRAQDYNALMRLAIMHGEQLGTGLGAFAVASRISGALGAKNFHLLAQSSDSESNRFFLSACYSQG